MAQTKMEVANETVGTATPKRHLAFGEAIKALTKGLRVRRSSWGSDHKFIFEQVPSIVPKEIVPKMTSLPQTVKDYFADVFEDENEQLAEIRYGDQLAMVNLSGYITSYSPSTVDSLANDWEVLD